MSAVATSTLFVVVLLAAIVMSWWRTILKVLVVTVFVLSAVGMAEIVSAVVSGLTPN